MFAGVAGDKEGDRDALSPGQPHVGAAVVGVGQDDAVGFQQIPVEFRFQLHVAGAAVGFLFLHIGVAQGVRQ